MFDKSNESLNKNNFDMEMRKICYATKQKRIIKVNKIGHTFIKCLLGVCCKPGTEVGWDVRNTPWCWGILDFSGIAIQLLGLSRTLRFLCLLTCLWVASGMSSKTKSSRGTDTNRWPWHCPWVLIFHFFHINRWPSVLFLLNYSDKCYAGTTHHYFY